MKCLLILNTVAIVILLMRQRCRVQEHFVLQDKNGNDLNDVEILTTDPKGNLDRVSFAQIYAAIDQAKKEAKKEATEDAKKYTDEEVKKTNNTRYQKDAELRSYLDTTFQPKGNYVTQNAKIVTTNMRRGNTTTDFCITDEVSDQYTKGSVDGMRLEQNMGKCLNFKFVN